MNGKSGPVDLNENENGRVSKRVVIQQMNPC